MQVNGGWPAAAQLAMSRHHIYDIWRDCGMGGQAQDSGEGPVPQLAGRSGTLVGHGSVRPAVLMVAITFPPAAVGSSVRVSDARPPWLPRPDEAVVPE